MAIKTKCGWRKITCKVASVILELRGCEAMLNRVRDGCNVHAVENHRNVCLGYAGLLGDGCQEPGLLDSAVGALRRTKDFLRKYADRLRPKPDEARYPEE